MTDEIRANFKAAFTLEDRATIEKMIEDGKEEFIASVLNIETPHQEMALQKFLDAKRQPIDPEGSRIRKEMMEREAKGEELIETPAQEAEWQAKLDAEKSAKPKAQKEEKAEHSENDKAEEVKEPKSKRKYTKKKAEKEPLIVDAE